MLIFYQKTPNLDLDHAKTVLYSTHYPQYYRSMWIFRSLGLLACMMLVLTSLMLLLYDHTLITVRDIFLRLWLSPIKFRIYKQREEVHIKQSHCGQHTQVLLQLPDLAQVDSVLLDMDHHHLVFLLETSGKNTLTVRQGCAVESAARGSGRTVVLLMTARSVDVCDKKMESLLLVSNHLVVHLNTSLLVSTTPLHNMFADGRVGSSCCKTIHLSDIFRIAALYRWGGRLVFIQGDMLG